MEAKMSVDLLSRLPVDIVLHHVLSRLDYVSWVRAGAVSSSWNSLASHCPPPLPPPLGDSIPWIWLSDGEPTPKPNAGRASFPLIITSAKRRRSVHRNHDDYRLVSFFLNHPGPDIVKVLFLYSIGTVNGFLLPFSRTALRQYPTAALLCPGQTTSWVAAAASDYNRDTTVKDLIFHKGGLYCINQAREVVAFDISQSVIQPPRVVVAGRENVSQNFIQPPHVKRSTFYSSSKTAYFLVESLHGELLIVEKNCSKKNLSFIVHRVEELEGKLVQVLDLGEEMLFVGGGCSRSILYGSRARKFPFFTRNCIYFFKQRGGWASFRDYDRYSVGKFSVKNNNVVCCEDELLNRMLQPIWIPSIPSPIDEEKI